MNELMRIVSGLRLTLPSINLEQMIALERPAPSFEAHVPAEEGRDYWVYSVDGKTLDGEVIVVRASLPMQAEALAAEGLFDTIQGAKYFNANAGLQSEVEVRGVE